MKKQETGLPLTLEDAYYLYDRFGRITQFKNGTIVYLIEEVNNNG